MFSLFRVTISKAIYPQVQTSLLGFNEINELVKNLIFNKLVIARSRQFDEIIDFERDNDEPMYFDIFQNEISGEIGYLKSYFMSVLFTEYEFKGGGAWEPLFLFETLYN